MLPGTGLGFLG